MLMFLVLVFYQTHFCDPFQTCVQEYARYIRIDAFLYLNAYHHYRVISWTWKTNF